jgi:hypothetical protein
VGPAVGLGGIEPPTSALSVLRSNRLSYSPASTTGHAGYRVPPAPTGTLDYTLVSGVPITDDGHLDATHDVADQVVEHRRDYVDEDAEQAQYPADG